MVEIEERSSGYLPLIRWTARILGGMLGTFVVILAVAHLFAGEEQGTGVWTARDVLMMCAFIVLTAGLYLGWWRESVGGLLNVGGFVAFYLLDLGFSGDFPRGWVFPVLVIPGILYLVVWRADVARSQPDG